MNSTIWGQSVVTLNKIDFYGALRLEYTSYGRDGLYKNGAYAANSFGKSETAVFLNADAKAGLTYKLNGKIIFQSLQQGGAMPHNMSRPSYCRALPTCSTKMLKV